MSTNQDSRKPGEGLWPLQHRDYDKGGDALGGWTVDMRSCRLAWRITGRDQSSDGLGGWKYDQDSPGDIHGGQLLPIKSRGGVRGIPMWRFATPAVISSIAGQQTSVATGPKGGEFVSGGTSRFQPIWNDKYDPDDRFMETAPNRPSRNGKEMFPKFTVDSFGISLTANYEARQVDLFMPTDPRMIAVNQPSDPEFGSLVCDMGPGNKIDLDRMPRLQSMMRVLLQPQLVSGGTQKAIAWNVGPSGMGDTRGGFMFEARGGTGADAPSDGLIPVATRSAQSYVNPFALSSGDNGVSPANPANGAQVQGITLPPMFDQGPSGKAGDAGAGNGDKGSYGQRGRLILGLGGKPLKVDGFGFGQGYGFTFPNGKTVPVMGGDFLTSGGSGGFKFGDKFVPFIGGGHFLTEGKMRWVFPPDPPNFNPWAKAKPKSNGPGRGVQQQAIAWLDPDIDLLGYQNSTMRVAGFDAPPMSASETIKNATGVVSMMSQFDSGLMEVGVNGDKHTLGHDADNHEIHSSHVSTNAYFYQNSEKDAPLEFGGYYPRDVFAGPYRVKAHIAYDQTPQHSFVGGPKQGLWRLYSYCFFEEKSPPTKTPGLPIPKTKKVPPPPPPPDTPTGTPNPGKGDPPPGRGLYEMHVPQGYYGGGGGAGGQKGGGSGDPPPSAVPNSNPPLADMAIPWESYYRRHGYPFPPNQPANPVQWMPGWTESYAGTSRTIGMPAIVGTPQNQHANAVDLRRFSGAIPQALIDENTRSTPVVGRIEAFGSQQGCTYGYNQRPGVAGRFPGGTSNGGFALMPPEFDILDARSNFSRPNIVSPSTTYFTAVPGAFWAAGIPSITNGRVKSGYRWGLDGSNNLVFSQLDSNGVPSTAFKLDGGVTYDGTTLNIPRDTRIKKGTSTGTAEVLGKHSVTVSTASNTGGVETDLLISDLQANALQTNYDGLLFDAFGTFANNSHNKTLTFYVGTTPITLISASPIVNQNWHVQGQVWHTGGNSQRVLLKIQYAPIATPGTVTEAIIITTTSETDTGAIRFKFTGNASTTGDITQESMFMMFSNN